MSYVRGGRPQQHTRGKRPVRPKTTAASKREWVSDVNDLTVHKLTPAELSYRHEIHKSHNKAAAQWELKERALKCRLRHAGSPAPLDKASLSIIREVFSDQLLLQDVLARSDRAMAAVKDLFGDASRRQTGHPSVTMAPNCDSDSPLPVLQRPDPPTPLSLLSQSMMDQQALNELQSSEENHSDEETPAPSPHYNLIRRTNVRKMKAKTRGRVVQQPKAHHHISEQRHRDDGPVTPCTSGRAPDQTALNATAAVQRVQSRRSQSEEAEEELSFLVSQVLNPELPLNQSGRTSSRTPRTRKHVSKGSSRNDVSVASLSGDQSSLGLLQNMLGQVEVDLDSMNPQTEPVSAGSPKQHRTQSLTGFSVALVSTLGRMVGFLRQHEEGAQREAQERSRLEEKLTEQRGLIDALTAETMTLRGEVTWLQAQLRQQTAELEQKFDTVVLAMGGLGLLGTHNNPPQDSDVKAADDQSAPVAERGPERTRVSVSPAVLLSPPRQADNWRQIPETHPVLLHQDPPPVDVLCSYNNLMAHSSASSLTSLPLTSFPSTSSLSLTSDPLRPQLSPEAMLAEIAELGRQNERIRALLSQTKGGLPNSGGERRHLSCSSITDRIQPQSGGGRRMSESRSTERRSQHIQSAEAEQLTSQETSQNTPSVSSVQQCLLEVNRRSATARGRLLELIEQQKQSVSAKVSPSASPIPPSAFSPHTAAGGGSPEGSIPAPAEESQSKSSGTGSEVSSQGFGGQTRDGKTRAQMDEQGGRGGWFALSAHVR